MPPRSPYRPRGRPWRRVGFAFQVRASRTESDTDGRKLVDERVTATYSRRPRNGQNGGERMPKTERTSSPGSPRCRDAKAHRSGCAKQEQKAKARIALDKPAEADYKRRPSQARRAARKSVRRQPEEGGEEVRKEPTQIKLRKFLTDERRRTRVAAPQRIGLGNEDGSRRRRKATLG